MLAQTTSVRELYAKVRRDFNIRVELADVVEWAAEAVQFIGTSIAMEPKEVTKKTYDYRTSFPPDCYNIEWIEYGGEVLPYGERINAIPQVSGNVYSTAKYDMGEETINGVSVYSSQQMSSSGESTEYYYIDGIYIKTSFEEDEITIHYKAFPVDKEGLPMIPGNVSALTAMAWYVVLMHILRGNPHPVITYEIARINWLKYCQQAGNDLVFPSVDKMEYLKERWLNTVRNDTY